MKKLVALVLALALCLSLCSVTAFADEINGAFSVTYSKLDYKTGEVGSPSTGDGRVDYSGATLYLCNDTEPVYACQGGDWCDCQNDYDPIEQENVDFSKVNKAFWILCFRADNDTFGDSFTLTVNGTPLDPVEFVGEFNIPEGYEVSNSPDKGELYIYIWQDISGDDDDGCKLDCKTLAKGVAIAAGITAATVGTIHTVKAVGNAIKMAVVMPCVVHAMKWAVPAALAALCRAVWHLR